MMELSSKSKTIKRKSKKKKIRIPESAIVPLIKPNAIDGISNWVRMQKMIEPAKKEKNEKQTGRERIVGVDLNSKSYKPSFNQSADHNLKNSCHSSREKYMEINAISIQSNTSDKLSNSQSFIKPEQSEVTKSQNQSYKFNFNTSTSHSPDKNSKNEAKRKIYEEKTLTKAVAMDCEMVGTGPHGEESMIARVSIVNSFGVCLYDEFVKPKERVTDFRTEISGVRPSDLKNGKDLFEVQREVLNIIEGRILVGHSIKHDLDVLFLSHPKHLIRDTAFYKPFRDLCGGRTPSLKKLTSKVLGCDIQSGEHSSVEDAQATMLLYLRMKKDWEKEVKAHRKRKPKLIENQMKC